MCSRNICCHYTLSCIIEIFVILNILVLDKDVNLQLMKLFIIRNIFF